MTGRCRLRPDHHIRSVLDISPGWCEQNGVKALLLDLDNTLTGWRAREFSGEILQWLQRMKDAGIQLLLLTNNRSRRRVRAMEEKLGIPAIGWASKPRVKSYYKALDALGREPDEVAAVGDQLFTDVVGANRAGIRSIMVDPFTHREFLLNHAFRWIERLYLRRIGQGEPERLVLPEEEVVSEEAEPNDG
jgi:HAD superfamily phosphatase (TIGR01668 family)